jgi:AraC family transcriptional regulator
MNYFSRPPTGSPQQTPSASLPPRGYRPGIASTPAMVSPLDAVRRRFVSWNGIDGDLIETTRLEPFEYAATSPFHLLIITERGERTDGETIVEGIPRSTRREFNRTLSFVPAGHAFHGWQVPRVLARFTYLYIDPEGPLLDPDLGFSEIEFKPQLFFYDRDIWETAFKLRMQVENADAASYAEALGLVLAHELIRLHRGPTIMPTLRGGLAGWQKRKVADYIEDHLGEDISLRDIATIANLSPFHFARAFKQSFGEPPHRYHMTRRMERAKALLESPARSVTQIGATLGFSETSAFTNAFRRAVGTTPSDYRRQFT